MQYAAAEPETLHSSWCSSSIPSGPCSGHSSWTPADVQVDLRDAGLGRQGSWSVCWEDDKICHYPLRTIPVMLLGSWLLIASRIWPNRNTGKKHHRWGQESISFKEPYKESSFFYETSIKAKCLTGCCCFREDGNCDHAIILFIYPALSSCSLQLMLFVKILYRHVVTQW